MDNITQREMEILKILKNDPMISQDELAKIVGITRSAAAVHISNLIKKGYILGRGYVFNDRTGILVVGQLMVDINVREGKTETDANIKITHGGFGYISSIYLASRGIPASVLSVVGRDDWGNEIVDKLKKNGVDTRYLLINKDIATPRQTTIYSKLTNKKSVFSDRNALKLLNIQNVPSLGNAVNNSKFIMVDCGIPIEMIRYIKNLAEKSNVPVCLNISDDYVSDIVISDFKNVHMAVLPASRAEEITGVKIRDLDECITAGRKLHEVGVDFILIVFAGQGAALISRSENIALPLSPTAITSDEYASADIMMTATLAGVIEGYDFRQAARFALGNSTRIMTERGFLSEKQEIWQKV